MCYHGLSLGPPVYLEPEIKITKGFIVKILNPEGDAIIKFANGTVLRLRLDPRDPATLRYIPGPLKVGPLIQVYDGLRKITARITTKDLKTGITKTLTLEYRLVDVVRDRARGEIVKVFRLSEDRLKLLKATLLHFVREDILGEIPYELVLRISARGINKTEPSVEQEKTYSIEWKGKNLLGITIVRVTHTVIFTYDEAEIVRNGGVITADGIPGYYFHNEIKVDGRVVDEGFQNSLSRC